MRSRSSRRWRWRAVRRRHAVPEPPCDPIRRRLPYWSASGRLALSAGGEGGSGAFVWEQREQTSQLDLRGPFGAGAVRVVATPDSLAVADGAGRSVDADGRPGRTAGAPRGRAAVGQPALLDAGRAGPRPAGRGHRRRGRALAGDRAGGLAHRLRRFHDGDRLYAAAAVHGHARRRPCPGDRG